MPTQTRLKSKQVATCHEDEEEVESAVESDSDNSDNLETQLKQSLEDLLDRKLTEHMKDLATKDCIKDLRNTISEQNSRIAVLEAKVIMMEKLVERLEQSNDDVEQYQRRLCLRISGIKMEPNETGEKCLEKVKEVCKELNADVPDLAIDRAHRIGRTTTKNGKSSRQMIVRFTTWRHRTKVYRARKTKTSGNYKVHLDITQKRLNMTGRANDWLTENGRANCFAFADVNCRPCLKLEDGFHDFSNESELDELLQPMEDDKSRNSFDDD